MQAIDAGLGPGAGSWIGDAPVPTQLYVRIHCEAVARVRRYSRHDASTAQHIALLASSYPAAPFGEHQEELGRAFTHLAHALGEDRTTLWHTYGI